jgi:hypothetical protein
LKKTKTLADEPPVPPDACRYEFFFAGDLAFSRRVKL